jgi:hypothetical protein
VVRKVGECRMRFVFRDQHAEGAGLGRLLKPASLRKAGALGEERG